MEERDKTDFDIDLAGSEYCKAVHLYHLLFKPAPVCLAFFRELLLSSDT